LRLNGALDLRLLTGFVPDVDARGPAQINASFEGTLDRRASPGAFTSKTLPHATKNSPPD